MKSYPRLRRHPQTTKPSILTSPNLNQTISLRNGRTLGYAEYGLLTGYPLLFLHGFPSSRLEGIAVQDIAKRRGLRIIAPDRPGYGLSTFNPSQRITDWPDDVQSLMDHLQIPRFAVLGGSGGAPYALACALALPRERMTGVGLFAAAGPWVAGREYISWVQRGISLLATYSPGLLGGILDGVVGGLRWCVSTRAVTRWLDNWIEREGSNNNEDESKRDLTTEEQREQLLHSLFEAFAQGSRAAVQEAVLLSHDWGFRFEDVDYDRILIWHGERDRNSPIQLIRYMAERLPHCVLREFEGETHFTLAGHLEEILAEFVTDEMLSDIRG